MKQVKVLGSCIKRFDALTTTIVKDAADTASIDVTTERIQVLRLAPQLTLALLAACVSQPAAAPASIGACQSTINGYGSRAELNEHPDTVDVSLRNVAHSPNAIGYGPGAGYLAELTVVDGVWQIARATGPEAVTVDTVPADEGGGPMVAYSCLPAGFPRTRKALQRVHQSGAPHMLPAPIWSGKHACRVVNLKDLPDQQAGAGTRDRTEIASLEG